MAAYKPKLAIMKVVSNSPNRIEVYYHPVAYLVLASIFAALCVWVALWQAADGNWKDVALLLGFASIMLAGFGGIFYRKVRLTMDRMTGQITHAKTVFFRNSVEYYPLEDLARVTVDTSFTGDTAMHRALMQFHSRDAVPVLRAYISGGNGIEIAETLQAWLESPGNT